MTFTTIPTSDEFYNHVKNLTFKDNAGIPYLESILKDLGLYQVATSPMAKRNLLTSIQGHIRGWGSKVFGGSPLIAEAIKALKEVVDKQIGPSRTYTHVRCVAWKVSTGTSTSYLVADPNSDRLDMRKKCAKMKAAINAARTQLANFTGPKKDDTKTLKVFMAPEFYFRGVNGAYPEEVVSDIIGIMMKQEIGSRGNNGTGHDLFKDWLFVFGTAVCAFEDEQGKAEIHNVALIQKGKDTYTVAKEFVSGIDYQQDKVDVRVTDFVPGKKNTGVLGGHRSLVGVTTKKRLETVPPSGSSQTGIWSKHNDERMGGCIFTVDGITFGLEVCLDHLGYGEGRLAKQCESVQVLLVPSYGMTIGKEDGPQDGGMYCKLGGIAFNVDGRGNGGAEVKVRDDVGDAPKPSAPYTPPGIDGSISYFGPFQLPPN